MVISDNNSQAAVGYFGGSFDPIHFGHLRVATEFAQAFNLSSLALMPCYRSPHRELPNATAQQRLRMLELAVQNSDILTVDGRELLADSASYTIDSLKAIREELGEAIPLYFAMGADAFAHIESWKDWQQLFSLANIVVLQRPGYVIDIESPWLKQKHSQFAGHHAAAGKLYQLAVTSLGISSTQIRHILQHQLTAQYLLPDAVLHYIEQQRLYQS